MGMSPITDHALRITHCRYHVRNRKPKPTENSKRHGHHFHRYESNLMDMQLTGIIKKAGNYYVALCLELNVSSQGESIEETRRMLQEACEEYLSYIKEKKLEDEIRPAPLDAFKIDFGTVENLSPLAIYLPFTLSLRIP